MRRLILFDIDGTLVRTQNGYRPFNDAILRTFGVAGDIRTVIPDGNTDPRIVEEIFQTAKYQIHIDAARWDLFAADLEHCYRNSFDCGAVTVRALPGALELVKALAAEKEFAAAVVTGNFKVTARLKLEAAGLAPYLSVGAYGCDSPHRPDLPEIARQRWIQLSGESIAKDRCIVVGDTPRDIEAARHSAMKCVLVGTGRYPVEELEYYKPDASLADLTDTQSVLGLFSKI
jgi:phosphoglycolate phosphatase-like HAD superfamily hydrolase